VNRLLLACAIVGTTGIAVADKPAGQRAFSEGQNLYASGDYAGAAEHFEAAFASDPDPAYVYNAGQAHRLRAEQKADNFARDCASAAKAYKRFLQLMPEPPNRDEVNAYVTQMERCAGALLQPDEPIEKPVDSPIEPPVDRPIDHPSDPIDRGGSGSGLRTGMYISGGIAAVGIGIGTYYGIVGYQLRNEHPVDGGTARRNEDRGHAANKYMAVSMAVGGAALATGVVLYVLGRRSHRESRVTVAPGRGGATVMLHF